MPALFSVLLNRCSLLILLIGCGFITSACLQADKSIDDNSPAKINSGIVRYVVDGDSLYLVGLDTQIRLWGVDAPERNEAGFTAARDALRLLALGRHLSCITKDIDRYKRIVARCAVTELDNSKILVKEGADFDFDPSVVEINKAMLEGGAALEYCYFSLGYYGFCQ